MAVIDQHTHHQKFGRRASFKFRALLESYESSFTHAYTVTIVSRAACRPSHLSGHACWRARSVSVQTEARGRAHTWLSAAPTHARTLSQPHHSPLSLPPVFPRVGSLVYWWPLMPPHSWGGWVAVIFGYGSHNKVWSAGDDATPHRSCAGRKARCHRSIGPSPAQSCAKMRRPSSPLPKQAVAGSARLSRQTGSGSSAQ